MLVWALRPLGPMHEAGGGGSYGSGARCHVHLPGAGKLTTLVNAASSKFLEPHKAEGFDREGAVWEQLSTCSTLLGTEMPPALQGLCTRVHRPWGPCTRVHVAVSFGGADPRERAVRAGSDLGSSPWASPNLSASAHPPVPLLAVQDPACPPGFNQSVRILEVT